MGLFERIALLLCAIPKIPIGANERAEILERAFPLLSCPLMVAYRSIGFRRDGVDPAHAVKALPQQCKRLHGVVKF